MRTPSKRLIEAAKAKLPTKYVGARRHKFVDGSTEADVLLAMGAAAASQDYILSNDIAARYNMEICCRCCWLASTWSVKLDRRDRSWVRACSLCVLHLNGISHIEPGDDGRGRELERTINEEYEAELADEGLTKL